MIKRTTELAKRAWSWATGGELVWLKDHDGEVTLAIAYKTPFDDLIASRHWPLNNPIVLLKDDGTTAGLCYVERWKRIRLVPEADSGGEG